MSSSAVQSFALAVLYPVATSLSLLSTRRNLWSIELNAFQTLRLSEWLLTYFSQTKCKSSYSTYKIASLDSVTKALCIWTSWFCNPHEGCSYACERHSLWHCSPWASTVNSWVARVARCPYLLSFFLSFALFFVSLANAILYPNNSTYPRAHKWSPLPCFGVAFSLRATATPKRRNNIEGLLFFLCTRCIRIIVTLAT